MREQTARAIIEVNEAITAADNLQELSDTLFSTLSNRLKLEWLALYNIFPRDTKLNATVSGKPPAMLTQQTPEFIKPLRASMNCAPGTGRTLTELNHPSEVHSQAAALVMTLTSSPVSHRLCLVLNGQDTDPLNAELLHGIRPLIGACCQAILERRQADLRAALNPDDLLRPYILIDPQGALVDFSPASMALLQGVYLDQELNQLPLEIASWIKQAINQAPHDCAENLLIFRRIGLRLKTVLLDGGQSFYLLHLIDKRSPDDFSPLCDCGLTAREIEVLNYLPTGYSNAQIAMALGIKEITVKKHLKTIGDKLGASGKTEILYTALAKLLDLRGQALSGL